MKVIEISQQQSLGLGTVSPSLCQPQPGSTSAAGQAEAGAQDPGCYPLADFCLAEQEGVCRGDSRTLSPYR